MLNQAMIGKIIQCHIDDSDPESFVVGRLVCYDARWIMMKDLSTSGHWNGIALYMRSDIVMVNEATDYLQKILTLVKCWGESEPYVPTLSDDLLSNVLQYARESGRLIALELHRSGVRDITGTIEYLSPNTVLLKQVDEYGFDDGKSYVSIDAISRCFMDDDELMCLAMLMACR